MINEASDLVVNFSKSMKQGDLIEHSTKLLFILVCLFEVVVQ